jgi:signal transduction histidine kinase
LAGSLHAAVPASAAIGARLRVEIEDTGPGVPAGHQLRIFEPYVQLRPGSGSGIGLGLATVDRLVRAHGGAAGVVSPVERGHGSLFWFELPIARTPRPAAVPAPAPVPR